MCIYKQSLKFRINIRTCKLKKALKRAAYEQGMRIFLCNADEDPAKKPRFLKPMRDEQIAGIILSPALKNKQ